MTIKRRSLDQLYVTKDRRNFCNCFYILLPHLDIWLLTVGLQTAWMPFTAPRLGTVFRRTAAVYSVS